MIDTVCIFEDSKASQFFPIALARPVYDLRCGTRTLRQKLLTIYPQAKELLHCREYLADLVREQNPGVPVNNLPSGNCLFLNGRLLRMDKKPPDFDTGEDVVFQQNGDVVAAFVTAVNGSKIKLTDAIESRTFESGVFRRIDVAAQLVSYPWDLVHANCDELTRDFEFLNQGGQSDGEIHDSAVLLDEKNICLSRGSVIKPGVVLDAESGPIYIGNHATVMANAVIEGPAYVGNNSTIKIGAKIYEGTSIGEVCKIGGEVEESIVHAFSNKQHDGFLGHAYLCPWVNLGADTNNSDLKNNYGTVRVHINGEEIDSGSLFVGLFIGDHSKSAINTMFNTGTVVGVMSNVFGGSFPSKAIPSFSWGGGSGSVRHDLERALATARKVMERRGIVMTDAYEQVFRRLYKSSFPEK